MTFSPATIGSFASKFARTSTSIALASTIALGAMASTMTAASADQWGSRYSDGHGAIGHGRFEQQRNFRGNNLGHGECRSFIDRRGYQRSVCAPQQQIIQRQKRDDKSAEVAIIAGIAGLVVGGIIAANQNKQQVIQQPMNNYKPIQNNAFPQAPTRVNQPYIVQANQSYEPWSQGWNQWCNNKYRSFNSQTGTFRGYDGLDHFCVVK